MSKRQELMEKLEERFRKGEISKDLYDDLREELGEEKPKTERAEPTRSEKISISGAGKLSGPVFTERFSVSGAGKVDGDVDATEFRASGSIKVNGSIRSDEFRTSGAIAVSGNIKARSFHNSGGGKVGGNIEATQIHNSGGLKVGGAITADEVSMSGSFEAKSLKARELTLSGSFDVKEAMEAKEARIELGGNCSAGTIKADELQIKTGFGSGFWGGVFGSSKGRLTVDLIEGKEIIIDAVRAKSVKGDEVHIGPDCDIDVVEARSLRVHEDARVKKRVAKK